MSTRAAQVGAVGAVLDGFSRDTREIRALRFPTFSYGPYAQDQAPRGKVVDFRVPLTIEGVRVHPGDIVFGDVDGVCVVPQEAADDVFAHAFEKRGIEGHVRARLSEGASSTAVFERYGVM